MAELEKVIKGLECWLDDDAHCPDDDCPYMKLLVCDQAAILHDAISLLKAQEPRVMTYDEMMKAEICFLEVKGIEEIDPFIRYEVNDKSYWSSPYTNSEDNPFELLAEQEEYLINARCWTSRPTDEQRKAVKWNEPPKEET
jgi:hypothetical protein